MTRAKKIIILVIALLLIAGGIFNWWNQRDVRELNKNLPEGIRVVKTLWGDYKVVNKIDGYEFKIPREWKGIEEIKYVPESTEREYTASSMGFEGKEGASRIMAIDRFRVENLENLNLQLWAKTNFETFGLVGDFSKDKIEELEIVKAQEHVHLLGMDVYFFKTNFEIYAITGGSENFIKYIISNGKW